RINSMTTSTAGTIFGLYKVGSGRSGDAASYLVTINPVNGNVTPVGIVPTQVPLDGLTFVPDDLVQCQGD
ncbi:MAG: hypothetical protein O7C98_09480, partial [Planctomycetota bacterium]|nr:hypothetical protein [Planctomycetota bacterium]